LLKNEKILKIV